MNKKQYDELLEQAFESTNKQPADQQERKDNIAKADDLLTQAIALEPELPNAYYNKYTLLCYKKVLKDKTPSMNDRISVEAMKAGFDNLCLALKHTNLLNSDLVNELSKFFPKPKGLWFIDKPKLQPTKDVPTVEQLDKMLGFILEKYKVPGEVSGEHLELFKEVYDEFISEGLEPFYNSEILRKVKLELAGLLHKDTPRNYHTKQAVVLYKLDQFIIYKELEDSESAENVAELILDEDPDFIKNWSSPGFDYIRLHKLQKLTIFDPKCAKFFFNAGRKIDLQYPNEPLAAAEYYKKAIQLMGSETEDWYPRCYRFLGIALQKERMHKEALVFMEQAGKIIRYDPECSLEKARIYKGCKLHSSAYHQYEHTQTLLNSLPMNTRQNENLKEELDPIIVKEKEELLRHFGSKILQEDIDSVKAVLKFDSEAQKKKDMVRIDQDKALKDYYNQFVFTLSSLYSTSQVVLSGTVQLDAGNMWVDLGAQCLSMLPFYGSTIESIFSAVAEMVIIDGIKEKAHLFCLLAPNQTGLDYTVDYIARKIVLNSIKKKSIMKLVEEKKKAPISGFWLQMTKVYDKFKSVAGFDNYNLRSNTMAAKQALEDATVLIMGLMKNKALLNKEPDMRDDEIVDLFFDLTEEHEKKTKQETPGKEEEGPSVGKETKHKKKNSFVGGGLMKIFICGASSKVDTVSRAEP